MKTRILTLLLFAAGLIHGQPPSLGTASGAAAARDGSNIVLPNFLNNLGATATGSSILTMPDPGNNMVMAWDESGVLTPVPKDSIGSDLYLSVGGGSLGGNLDMEAHDIVGVQNLAGSVLTFDTGRFSELIDTAGTGAPHLPFGMLNNDDEQIFLPGDAGTLALTSDLAGYQAALVSGTNIKTVNGSSLLGSGNLTVSGGASTNAEVNDLLDNDPNASQLALGVPQNNRMGMHTSSFRGSVKNIRMVTFGDSLVNDPPLSLSAIYSPAGGYCAPDGSLDISGTSVGTDWTNPGGRYVSLPNGSTRRWGTYNVTASASPFLRASQFKIYYIVGAGTLRVRSATGTSTSFSDVAGHTAIDTSVGTTGTIAVRTVSMANSNFYRIETVSDSGTIKIIGLEAVELANGNRDSYRVVNLGLGGSFDTSWTQVTQANWNSMLWEINPQIVVFKAATFHVTDDGTMWRGVIDKMRAALPKAMFMLVGTHPWQDNPDPLIPTTLDGQLKAYAVANPSQVIFADIRRYWPNYARMASAIPLVVTSATDLVTATSHGFSTAETVTVSNTGGALPSPLAAATTYYVIRISADTFKLATSYANAIAGTAIDITTTGTGTNSLNTGGTLMATDGIHITQGVGTSFQTALLNHYVPTLVGPGEVNMVTGNLPTYNTLSDVVGAWRSGFGGAPNWTVTGDLANSNGNIGFSNFVGTSSNTGTGATWRAFATGANFRVGGGFALGLSPTSHAFVTVPRNNSRSMFANFGNAESTLLRDPTGRLEILPALTTESALVIGANASQTADLLEFYSGTTLSTPGTKMTAITATGGLRFDATGSGITLKSATNGRIGTGVALTAGVATVANTSVTANTQVLLTCTAVAGTPGVRIVVTKTAAASFTLTAINSAGTTETADTSTFDWQLTERQ